MAWAPPRKQRCGCYGSRGGPDRLARRRAGGLYKAGRGPRASVPRLEPSFAAPQRRGARNRSPGDTVHGAGLPLPRRPSSLQPRPTRAPPLTTTIHCITAPFLPAADPALHPRLPLLQLRPWQPDHRPRHCPAQDDPPADHVPGRGVLPQLYGGSIFLFSTIKFRVKAGGSSIRAKDQLGWKAGWVSGWMGRESSRRESGQAAAPGRDLIKGLLSRGHARRPGGRARREGQQMMDPLWRGSLLLCQHGLAVQAG